MITISPIAEWHTVKCKIIGLHFALSGGRKCKKAEYWFPYAGQVMDFTPDYSYNRFFRCKLFLRCLIKGDFINIVRYGICRRREWGMKDLQWILDTAASAYEKRFMKKNEDICWYFFWLHTENLLILLTEPKKNSNIKQ